MADDSLIMTYEKYKSFGMILIIFFSIIPRIFSTNITEDPTVETDSLSPQRMWDPEKGSIYGLTENPQQMWDPEKGSILGKNVASPTSHEDNATVSNQTVQVGSNTFLDCQVRNMADKKVSWIRRRDNHILTSGILTYTNDERFSVVRAEGSDNWALLIRFVQKRDEGRYECQVSTKTGRYGYSVDLNVVIPKATIVGSPELHVQSGSTISLLCTISNVLKNPHFLLWYHNTKVINHSQIRNGVVIETQLEPIPTTKLTITGATYDESGNYTCLATDSQSASVNVFVSEGDKTAAIQRLGSGSWSIKTEFFNSDGQILYIFLLISANYMFIKAHFGNINLSLFT